MLFISQITINEPRVYVKYSDVIFTSYKRRLKESRDAESSVHTKQDKDREKNGQVYIQYRKRGFCKKEKETFSLFIPIIPTSVQAKKIFRAYS